MTKNRMEAMLFDYGTTNRTDFRHGHLEEQVITNFKPKPTCLGYPRLPPLKDVHTLSNWKAPILFNLLHKPKDITGTDPSVVQKPYVRSCDADHKEAIRTRPRLVMTPAVSIDDIKDPHARAILLDDMYTSAAMQTSAEVSAPRPSVKAPLPDRPANSNPIKLRPLLQPVVSPEWRMDSVSWDSRQLRSYCPQTRLFWQRRERSRCEKCDESVAVAAQKNMQLQMMKRR